MTTSYAVVDLSNLLVRCRHAVRGDAYTKTGLTLHIVFRSLRKLHREFGIDHMVFAVDRGSWRNAAYPAYKARRKLERLTQAVEDAEEQAVFEQLSANLLDFLRTRTRCTVLERHDVEGDDFVARWVQRHPEASHIVVSGDSDFVQLLGPRVRIYDGVQERMLSTDGITDAQGARLAFSVESSKGRIKVGGADPAFVPEAEWWRKALFVKLIRGDSGDGIFAAFPGVRYNGSAKKAGLTEVWQDRHAQGFAWTNFWQQEWDKMEGVGPDGEPLVRRVRVLDEYRINEGLIDLTRQPERIKAIMDQVIDDAAFKPPVLDVGLHFLRFCGEHDLPGLVREASDHAAYLNAGYARSRDAA